MERKRRSQSKNSPKNPQLNLLFNLSSLIIIIMLIIGSQTFLASFPTNLILNPETNFSSTSFSLIQSNQITFNNNPTQITDGDVIPLSTGGYIKLQANQTTNTIDTATKYGRYQLNQVILLEQPLLDWDMEHYTLTLSSIDPSQTIKLTYHFLGDIIRVETPLNTFFAKLPISKSLYINSDDGDILFKITHTTKYESQAELIGWYESTRQIKITLQEI